jgi:hypothetical protein
MVVWRTKNCLTFQLRKRVGILTGPAWEKLVDFGMEMAATKIFQKSWKNFKNSWNWFKIYFDVQWLLKIFVLGTKNSLENFF